MKRTNSCRPPVIFGNEIDLNRVVNYINNNSIYKASLHKERAIKIEMHGGYLIRTEEFYEHHPNPDDWVKDAEIYSK